MIMRMTINTLRDVLLKYSNNTVDILDMMKEENIRYKKVVKKK